MITYFFKIIVLTFSLFSCNKDKSDFLLKEKCATGLSREEERLASEFNRGTLPPKIVKTCFSQKLNTCLFFSLGTDKNEFDKEKNVWYGGIFDGFANKYIHNWAGAAPQNYDTFYQKYECL